MVLSQPLRSQPGAKTRAGNCCLSELKATALLRSVPCSPSSPSPSPEAGRIVGLVDHALAQREVGVGQVGEGLQQDLGGDRGLEEGRG